MPGTTANADFDSGNRCCTGPGDTANGQLALLDFALGLRLGDQASHALQRYELSDQLSTTLPLVKVCLGLVMTTKPIADHTNLRKPFDRCHGIPSRNDGTQWVAMYDQERLAVHGVGKQRPRPMGGVVQAQTSLKANWFTTHIKFAAVGTAELLLSHPL